MKIISIGVTNHDILENAPRGYCLVEATLEDKDGNRILVQGERNPYTNGEFRWGQINPITRLHTINIGDLNPSAFTPSLKLVGLAQALKALFDALEV